MPISVQYIQFSTGATFLAYNVTYWPALFAAPEMWVYKIGTPAAFIVKGKPTAKFKVKPKHGFTMCFKEGSDPVIKDLSVCQ